MRTALRSIGWTMIWTGVFLLLFLSYQLWGTGLLTTGSQRFAEGDLADQFLQARESSELGASAGASEEVELVLDEDGKVLDVIDWADTRPTVPTLIKDTPTVIDEAFGTIQFPTLETRSDRLSQQIGVKDLAEGGQSWVMFEGVSVRTLKRGPGHMPHTPLPGQPGNAVISGHRTTYLAPFNRLDELEEGDPIIVETSTGTHVFVVRDPSEWVTNEYLTLGEGRGWFAVRPDAFWVTEPREGAWITLTTCHPEFSARQRLIVYAELVSGPNHDFIYGAGSS